MWRLQNDKQKMSPREMSPRKKIARLFPPSGDQLQAIKQLQKLLEVIVTHQNIKLLLRPAFYEQEAYS